MVERIKSVMAHYHMKAAQFADATGMQRSAVSHVLSGRNKPSLDFVLRIKRHFPDISLDWLTLGEGEMFESRTSVSGNLFSGASAGMDAKEGNSPVATPAQVPEERENEWKEEEQAPYRTEATGGEVEKIVFFYRNGTFRSFDPRNVK